MEGTVLRQPLEIMDLDQMVCPNLKGLDEVKVFSAMFLDPNKQGGSWKNSFMHILDQFAKCLHEECQEGLKGWMRNVGLQCMFLIPFGFRVYHSSFWFHLVVSRPPDFSFTQAVSQLVQSVSARGRGQGRAALQWLANAPPTQR